MRAATDIAKHGGSLTAPSGAARPRRGAGIPRGTGPQGTLLKRPSAAASISPFMRDQPQRSTWLCPTPGDRARMLDMERRLAPFRAATFGIVALAL